MRPNIASLDGERFDVVVVGGGINGASTAQHLAAAGYKTLIVDKGDFGSGSKTGSGAGQNREGTCLAAFKLLDWLGPGDLPLDYQRMNPSEARGHPLLRNLRDLDQLVGEFLLAEELEQGGIAVYRTLVEVAAD